VRALALALVVLALAGCGEDDPATTSPATGAGPTATAAGRESLVIQTDGGPVEVHAEIADSESERETGLMNRTSLDEDGGMLFVFDEDIQAAFWMKNTLIPLSIAFIDANGEIVTIRDMEPCKADPCPVYGSDAPYRNALEVNQGAFADWGVEVGDTVEIP
jgi:uncharacterized membrane protein (UPF0127 family)